MKHILTAAGLTTAMMLACPTDAALVLIDFGTAIATTGNAGGVQYNDIGITGFTSVGLAPLQANGAAGTTNPIDLLNTGNTSSGWTLQMELLVASKGVFGNQTGAANLNHGPFPTLLDDIEATALGSFMFLNRNENVMWTLAGLDDTKTYNIVVYGNGRNLNNGLMSFTPVIGSGTDYTPKSMDTNFAQSVNDDVLAWNGVAPVGGVIQFSTLSGNEGWLNFASIQEVVPEPGSLACVALGGLAMLRRRRQA